MSNLECGNVAAATGMAVALRIGLARKVAPNSFEAPCAPRRTASLSHSR